jgi:hypothetical protein
MDIDQLGKQYDLAPEVRDVVRLAREASGKDLDFRLHINLDTAGSSKIARRRMPAHIVKVKENSTVRVNHIIAHECGHILRTMQANPAERVVPSSNTETRSRALEALHEELATVSEAARSELFELWSAGLVNQLVNLPVDVRIERWLYESYPSFRDTQLISLAVEIDNCLAGLTDAIRKNTIPAIFNRSNAMIYAYLRGLSPITGENYAPHFKKYPGIKKTGRKLYAFLDSKDKGFSQDLETINAWAEILEIAGWFTWIGFEDMPESYYEESGF